MRCTSAAWGSMRAPGCSSGGGSAMWCASSSTTPPTRRPTGSSRPGGRSSSPRRSPRRALTAEASGRALRADRAQLALVVELGLVLHEEAAHARELVLLRGQHHDVEIDIRQILPGELETGVVSVVDVDHARQLVGHTLLE